MKFIAIATTVLSLLASCTLSFAAPLDFETGISPLGVRAGAVDVVLPNSDLLVKKAVADLASLNAEMNDMIARGADVDVVLVAIASITAQAKVIIAELSVKGIVIANVDVFIGQLVALIVSLKVQIDAVGTWDTDVVEIAVNLNALIVLYLDICISLKAELGLTVLVSLIADIQVSIQACLDVFLDVVVDLDVQILALIEVNAALFVDLNINLNVGGVLVGILGIL